MYELQTRTMDGDRWKQVKYRETREVPQPGRQLTMYDQAACTEPAWWRVFVHIEVVGIHPETGQLVPFPCPRW